MIVSFSYFVSLVMVPSFLKTEGLFPYQKPPTHKGQTASDMYVLFYFAAQDRIKSPIIRRIRTILSISQFSTCGIRKITNAAAIILRHSAGCQPEEQAGDSGQAMMKDRILMKMPEMLFKKIPSHWIRVTASSTGSSTVFRIKRITFIAAS